MNACPGEFIVLLGANGAGKSSLLKTILNLVKPKQGEIFLFNTCHKQRKVPIGYIPQFYTHLSNHNLSGKAWLMANWNGTRYGFPLPHKNSQETINSLLHLVEAEHYADQPFIQLSGGEKQRLLLAQALMHNPKLLLLDEPLNHLDSHYQIKFIELIERLRQLLGITVLITTHHATALINTNTKNIHLESRWAEHT